MTEQAGVQPYTHKGQKLEPIGEFRKKFSTYEEMVKFSEDFFFFFCLVYFKILFFKQPGTLFKEDRC